MIRTPRPNNSPRCKALPSQEELIRLFAYDPETGKLQWKLVYRADGRRAGYSGAVAGNINTAGYRQIYIRGRNYYAHRLIWKIAYGTEPVEIDHINGERDDNRLVNLRPADRLGNGKNTCGWHGRSLPKGVVRNKKRFSAKIMVNRERIHLGTFDTPEDAAGAYRSASLKYHGSFSRFQAGE